VATVFVVLVGTGMAYLLARKIPEEILISCSPFPGFASTVIGYYLIILMGRIPTAVPYH
jgi:ABC-type molybdate transport system permease subunit